MWLLINAWHLGSFCDPNVGGFHGTWELQTRGGIILGSIQVQQCRDKGPMESFAEILTRDKHITCHGYLDQANGLPCADSRADGWHHHDYSTALHCRQGRHLQPWRVSVQVCVSPVIRSSLMCCKEYVYLNLTEWFLRFQDWFTIFYLEVAQLDNNQKKILLFVSDWSGRIKKYFTFYLWLLSLIPPKHSSTSELVSYLRQQCNTRVHIIRWVNTHQ